MLNVQTEGKSLDHLYSTHRDTYKALPRPPFGKSDHNSIPLIPAYKQKLKQEAPLTRSIKKSGQMKQMLNYCFDCFPSTDWNMFRDFSNGIEAYTTLVIGFINKCIDDVVPTETVRTYPNQKPWITGNRVELVLSRSGTLTRKPIRNPAMRSDEPSNRQSVNTGLISNRTTPAPRSSDGAANYYPLQREAQPRAAQ